MLFTHRKHWLLILIGIVVVLVSLTSALVVQFQVSIKEANWFSILLTKFTYDWVAPLALPLSVSAIILIFILTIMIIKDNRRIRRKRESSKILSWARDTIRELTTPITEASSVLYIEEMKAKLQNIKASGLDILIDSRQISSDLYHRMWNVYSGIQKYSDAVSKDDMTFDFKGETNNLLIGLGHVINYTSK